MTPVTEFAPAAPKAVAAAEGMTAASEAVASATEVTTATRVAAAPAMPLGKRRRGERQHAARGYCSGHTSLRHLFHGNLHSNSLHAKMTWDAIFAFSWEDS
jgi:hypothetical protein